MKNFQITFRMISLFYLIFFFFKPDAVVSLSWISLYVCQIWFIPYYSFLYLYHCKTLNLVEFTVPLQPSSQFYYVIVIKLTRFKVSISLVNVHQFINIYIKKAYFFFTGANEFKLSMVVLQNFSNPSSLLTKTLFENYLSEGL